ncbi:dihydroxyacetone kinase subunit DhaL [Arcanobacterium hippocoleae]
MALDVKWALAWMRQSAAMIAEKREYLVDLDREIGDGDHGENLDRGFTALIKELDTLEAATPADVLKQTAKTLMSTVGGASGPLLGTAFLRAAKAVPAAELDADGVADLLAGGLEGIQVRGKAAEGEKTMVDAWARALAAAKEAAVNGLTAQAALAAAASAAEAGAAATKEMLATKGRASYLGERSRGHLDPGAVSSAYILRAAVKAAG